MNEFLLIVYPRDIEIPMLQRRAVRVGFGKQNAGNAGE